MHAAITDLERTRATVYALVKGLDIPIIDIHPAIQADGDPSISVPLS